MRFTLSTITPDDVIRHARLDDADEEETMHLQVMISAAQSFCLSYTGLTPEEADEYPDMAMAAIIIAADLYDNRSYTVDKDTVNPTVSTILGMHSRNLL